MGSFFFFLFFLRDGITTAASTEVLERDLPFTAKGRNSSTEMITWLERSRGTGGMMIHGNDTQGACVMSP